MRNPLPSLILLLHRKFDSRVHLIQCIQNCDKVTNKPAKFPVCSDAIEFTDNQLFGDGSSNQMAEEMSKYNFKDIFQPLFIQIFEKK